MTRYSLQSPSTGHCSNSLFCCSTMYSGNGSFYRIRIVQSFVKTISEQSLVRGGVARLPQGEIFLRKNQTHNPEFIFVEHDFNNFRTSENSVNIIILQTMLCIYLPLECFPRRSSDHCGIFNFHQERGRELSHQGDGGCFKI